MRKSREDWLLAGLMQLVKESVDALKIDRMCTHLGVTKGSFYHHFSNHTAFLEGVLEVWEREFTLRFIELSDEEEGAKNRLTRLMTLTLESHGTEEVGIRAWAQTSELAARYVERVDKRRLAYLEELFLGMTGEPAQAKTMAHLIYTTLVGSSQLFPPLGREDLGQVFALLQHWSGLQDSNTSPKDKSEVSD